MTLGDLVSSFPDNATTEDLVPRDYVIEFFEKELREKGELMEKVK